MSTPAAPFVAIETPTGTDGTDGLAVFTFAADITAGSEILVDRMPQGVGIDLTVTGTRQVTFIAPSIPVAGAQIWLSNGAAGTAVGTGLPAWDTVANLISDAAIELGLVSAPIADPFSSSDSSILLLVRLLKSGGRDIVGERIWSHLTSEYTFSTANGTATYALPSDFKSFIDDSGWNRTTRFPFSAPLTPQDWQFAQSVTIAGSLYTMVRWQGGQIKITPTPTSVATIAFEYRTTSWVRPSGQTVPTSSTPTAASDVVCFEPALIVRRLVRDFRKRKGFDYSAEEEDYRRSLEKAKNDDSPSSTIILGGQVDVPLLGLRNVPDTGYGP